MDCTLHPYQYTPNTMFLFIKGWTLFRSMCCLSNLHRPILRCFATKMTWWLALSTLMSYSAPCFPHLPCPMALAVLAFGWASIRGLGESLQCLGWLSFALQLSVYHVHLSEEANYMKGVVTTTSHFTLMTLFFCCAHNALFPPALQFSAFRGECKTVSFIYFLLPAPVVTIWLTLHLCNRQNGWAKNIPL